MKIWNNSSIQRIVYINQCITLHFLHESFFGIFLSFLFVTLHWTEKRKHDHVKNISFLITEILMNLDVCKAPLWFTTSTSLATKSWSWMVTLKNGFIIYPGLWRIRALLVLKFNWIHLPWLKGATFGNISQFYTWNFWASKDTNLAAAWTERVLPLWKPASGLHQCLYPHTLVFFSLNTGSKQSNTQGTFCDAHLLGKGPQKSVSDRQAIHNGPRNQIFPLYPQRTALHQGATFTPQKPHREFTCLG